VIGVPRTVADFAGVMTHELRATISNVCGELDLALARDRSAAEYRAALARVSGGMAALLDLTEDLAAFGDDGSHDGAATACLGAIFAELASRFGPRRGTVLIVDPVPDDCEVVGDEALIVRAISLVVEHALRHRRESARVRLRAVPAGDPRVMTVALALEGAAGFVPRAWQGLDGAGGADRAIRLETAGRFLRACGAALDTVVEDGAESVRVRFSMAPPAAID
jgi:signal transduction histidine kinase